MSRRFRSLIVLAALALPLTLAGCDSPEEQVERFVQDGQARLASGDADRAAIHFRNALRIEPKSAPALLGMARVHQEREDPMRAYAAFREAADADPESIEARNGFAVIALTLNRLDAVREAAEEIRALDPAHPDGLALAAALALRDERLDEAETLARDALANDPTHVNAVAALAGAFNARGDTRGAVDVLNERFESHGVTVPLALLKSQLLGSIGDTAGVANALEQAIAAAPDDAEIGRAHV